MIQAATRHLNREVRTFKDALRHTRREACRHDFNKFRKRYFPDYNTVEDAPFHTELSGRLTHITFNERGSKNAIAAPRESAKSTVVSLQYVIFCLCYAYEKLIALISATTDQANTLLRHIKEELTANELLAEDFPEVVHSGGQRRSRVWKHNEIITRNNIQVIARSVGQSLRGHRKGAVRPTLLILDDIENDEITRSPEQMQNLNDWFTKSLMKVGSEQTNIIYVGTIYHYNSMLAQFTSNDHYPGWYKRVYRSIVAWPVNTKLWEKWEQLYNNRAEYNDASGAAAAQAFYEDNKASMLEGAEVLWPQKKPLLDLMIMREQGGHYSFDSEMQNEPVNPRDCHFRMDEVHYWDDRFPSEEELLASFAGNVEFYGACDPSLGRQNRHGDYSAIVTVAFSTNDNRIFVLLADLDKRLPDKTIEAIIMHHHRYHYSMFGFESNQFQEFMATELEKRGREMGMCIPVEQIRNTTDKRARIETLQPMIKNGTIQFSRRQRQLLEQMKQFPKGAHDDGLDALEMVVRLCREYGNSRLITTLGGDDDDNVPRAPRDTGVWMPIQSVIPNFFARFGR